MPTTPKFKLTYFDARGRGEIARLLLVAAGEDFEDERLSKEEWQQRKSSSPQGTLPILTINGQNVIGQSHAIYRYLAREFGLFGKNSVETAEIDMLVETARDLSEAGMKMFLADEASKPALKQKLIEVDGPKYLGMLEKAAGENGFLHGSSLTLVDVVVFVVLDMSSVLDYIDNYPKLKKNRETFMALPRIAAFLNAKKESK